jgi:hypothetical protein
VIFVDGDIEASDTNIPAALAARWADADANMVVAAFEWVGRARCSPSKRSSGRS